jgi:phage baseplate assembly protein W
VATAIYKGFSTSNWKTSKSFVLTDIALVNQDLLNQIWTIKGERVMMPEYGTRIPVLTFEPNDNVTVGIIETDLTAVFNSDPRVKLLSLNISQLPNNNAIIAIANLLYVELQVTGYLNIEIASQ